MGNYKLYQNKDGKYLSIKDDENLSTRYINVSIGKNGVAMKLNNQGKLQECNKDLPELYKNKYECCGCGACYAICPVDREGESKEEILYDFIGDGIKQKKIVFGGALEMLPDEEGFLYPVINAQKCLRCYNCINICCIK